MSTAWNDCGGFPIKKIRKLLYLGRWRHDVQFSHYQSSLDRHVGESLCHAGHMPRILCTFWMSLIQQCMNTWTRVGVTHEFHPHWQSPSIFIQKFRTIRRLQCRPSKSLYIVVGQKFLPCLQCHLTLNTSFRRHSRKMQSL